MSFLCINVLQVVDVFCLKQNEIDFLRQARSHGVPALARWLQALRKSLGHQGWALKEPTVCRGKTNMSRL